MNCSLALRCCSEHSRSGTKRLGRFELPPLSWKDDNHLTSALASVREDGVFSVLPLHQSRKERQVIRVDKGGILTG